VRRVGLICVVLGVAAVVLAAWDDGTDAATIALPAAVILIVGGGFLIVAARVLRR
jgi:hypothetical protein